MRPAFAALRATPYVPLTDDGPMRILVLGGSLGAKVFSQVVPQALALMPDHLRRRIVIAQQCRKDDLERARAGFAAAGIEAELSPFFHDVPERMAQAQLVICRSGGSTIAELTAIGRPSILVPFPHGHAGEQTANAEAMAEAGGALAHPRTGLYARSLGRAVGIADGVARDARQNRRRRARLGQDHRRRQPRRLRVRGDR